MCLSFPQLYLPFSPPFLRLCRCASPPSLAPWAQVAPLVISPCEGARGRESPGEGDERKGACYMRELRRKSLRGEGVAGRGRRMRGSSPGEELRRGRWMRGSFVTCLSHDIYFYPLFFFFLFIFFLLIFLPLKETSQTNFSSPRYIECVWCSCAIEKYYLRKNTFGVKITVWMDCHAMLWKK